MTKRIPSGMRVNISLQWATNIIVGVLLSIVIYFVKDRDTRFNTLETKVQQHDVKFATTDGQLSNLSTNINNLQNEVKAIPRLSPK